MQIMGTKMFKSRESGVTLLEILLATLIMGLVTGGIFSAFVFSRQVAWRTDAHLGMRGAAGSLADATRAAVANASPIGWTLTPGIYVDDWMFNNGDVPPFKPPGAVALIPVDVNGNPLPNPLNLPPALQARYQTNPGTAPTWADHGDGMVMVVEGLNDLDGDGHTGFDFGTGKTQLRRVRFYGKWTTPSS